MFGKAISVSILLSVLTVVRADCPGLPQLCTGEATVSGQATTLTYLCSEPVSTVHATITMTTTVTENLSAPSVPAPTTSAEETTYTTIDMTLTQYITKTVVKPILSSTTDLEETTTDTRIPSSTAIPEESTRNTLVATEPITTSTKSKLIWTYTISFNSTGVQPSYTGPTGPTAPIGTVLVSSSTSISSSGYYAPPEEDRPIMTQMAALSAEQQPYATTSSIGPHASHMGNATATPTNSTGAAAGRMAVPGVVLGFGVLAVAACL